LACRYELFAAVTPVKWTSHIFRFKPLKAVLQFKEHLPFKCENKIAAVQCERPFDQYTTFSPRQFLLDSTFT
jgi:hypothetical protein